MSEAFTSRQHNSQYPFLKKQEESFLLGDYILTKRYFLKQMEVMRLQILIVLKQQCTPFCTRIRVATVQPEVIVKNVSSLLNRKRHPGEPLESSLAYPLIHCGHQLQNSPPALSSVVEPLSPRMDACSLSLSNKQCCLMN